MVGGVYFKFEQECGESVGRDQVEERSMSRVGVLFKDGGCAGCRIGPSAHDLRCSSYILLAFLRRVGLILILSESVGKSVGKGVGKVGGQGGCAL